MKKSFSLRYNLLSIVLLMSVVAMQATTYTTPKYELRSAWVATVWALDWPTVGASASTQKAEIDRMLDSLYNNNINAVNFQVRSMCDAMYKSSYEPWSSYLTGTRGQDPGYDPLAYVVEQCHKRGMECHAWINPYRFSSNGIDQWSTTADEKLKSDGRLLSSGNTVILDPAQQENIDRIVNVCKEVISNYDVDGILYDDYFYPDGISSSSDAGDYTEWQNSGTTLSIADWRRANVNKMVKAVYDMIQATKPYVRFGISPAGVTCTDATHASKYGVDRCMSGSDWQYNGIFSDPLAWLSSKTIDFISPQVYWTIGYSSADYSVITPWWSKVANKFGRHVYISHSISSLTAKSSAPGLSAIESTIRKASGPNSSSYSEFANEVEMNRTENLQNAPGSIYYSCRYLYNLGATESFAHYLHRTVYTRPALPPVMTWKAGNNPGVVKNLSKVAYTLSWNGYDNVRYTIYAVPNDVAQSTFNKDGAYLIAMTYGTTYEIPEAYRTGYQYAVCVLDRVGNEYSPIFLGAPVQQLASPKLIAPAGGATAVDPFDFTWHSVPNATNYTIEIASDAAFTKVLHTAATTDTVISSAAFENLKSDVLQYWRIHACALNYSDGVSDTQSFNPQVLSITYPANAEVNVDPAFTAKWTTSGSTDEAVFDIATDENFTESSTVFSGKSTNGTLQIPMYSINAGTTYYARVSMTHNGATKTTAPIMFTTQFMTASAPSIALPANGDTLYANQHIQVARQQAATSYVIEVSSSEATWGRTRFVETVKTPAFQTTNDAANIKVNSALMTDGTTYYARAKASYLEEGGTTANTDYGTIISFIYSAKTGGVNDINVSASTVKILGVVNPVLVVKAPSANAIRVNAYSSVGVNEGTLYNGNERNLEIPLNTLSNGMHIIVINIDGMNRAIKFIR